jgi:hypothetical protein
MLSKYSKARQLGIATEDTELQIDTVDKSLSKSYRRCAVCRVPLHKDGHEVPKWCSEKECTRTHLRSQPVRLTQGVTQYE